MTTENSTNPISPAQPTVIKNMAFWKLPDGVIAQYVSPSEIENLKNVRAITIQPGIVARIMVDNRLVAEKRDGVYEFVSQEQIDKLLESSAQNGLWHTIKNFELSKTLSRLIFGKTVKEQISDVSPNLKEIKTMDAVISALQPNSVVSIYLVRETPFRILFGAENGVFEPYNIKCAHLSAQVAVDLRIKVDDSQLFLTNVMSGAQIVSNVFIADLLNPIVEGIVSGVMRNYDIDEYGIPSEAREEIENQLKALQLKSLGMTLYQILSISCKSKEHEHFRTVADELYCEEKELEFLIRTNEFKNRLASVQNEQAIAESRTDFEMYKILSEIDKDRLLYDDELDKFYMLLSREKKIREAKNEEEIERALLDIEKTKLLSEDEYSELLTKYKINELERTYRLERNVRQHEREKQNEAQEFAHQTDKSEIDYLHQKELDERRHQSEMQNLEIEQRRGVDEYVDQRRETELRNKMREATSELDLTRQARQQDMDFIRQQEELKSEKQERSQRSAMEMLSGIHHMKEEKLQSQHQRDIESTQQMISHEEVMTDKAAAHEEKMRSMDSEDVRTRSTMSAEQLVAERASSLDKDAQKAFMESLGNSRVMDVERKAFEEQKELMSSLYGKQNAEMMNMSQDMMDRMERMFNVNAGVRRDADNAELKSAKREAEMQREMKDEYRRQSEHEQSRFDATQKHQMEHETAIQNASVDAIRAANIRSQILNVGPTPNVEMVVCPQCKNTVPKEKFCRLCHCELAIKG